MANQRRGNRLSESFYLDSADMLTGLSGKANLMSYEEITKCRTIYDVLGPYKQCVIIYEEKENVGHWCCVFMRDNGDIEFFDSYGFMIDDQVNFQDYYDTILPPMMNRNGMKIRLNYLAYLIWKYAGYKPGARIHYNDHRLQQARKGIATCGRWVLVRLWMKHMLIDDFAEMFGRDGDRRVTEITNQILGWNDGMVGMDPQVINARGKKLVFA